MLYSVLSFIFNLSGFCLLASIIYLIHYGLYMAYEKMITHVNNIVQYFYPKPSQNENMPKKITLESLYNHQKEFNQELDNLDGWKIIQNKDISKLKEDMILLKKDNDKLKLEFSIVKFDKDVLQSNLKNSINTLDIKLTDLKNSMNTLIMNSEKKINSNISNKFYDMKNTNDLEIKEINNKIFKIKCMIDK